MIFLTPTYPEKIDEKPLNTGTCHTENGLGVYLLGLMCHLFISFLKKLFIVQYELGPKQQLEKKNNLYFVNYLKHVAGLYGWSGAYS